MAVRADAFSASAVGDDTASGVLWIVAGSEEVAKTIESHLRNSGHPLRAEWLSSLEAIDARLRQVPPDLVLADREVRGVPRDRLLALCRTLAPDLPVLLIGQESSFEACLAALSAGARDYAAYGSIEHLRHLELVVLRELIQHQKLRELRATQARLADFEARHRQLTDSTGDAIGIVHEGILTGANLAFARLLGHASAEPLAGQPLIDLVESSQQARVKERLRAVLKGKSAEEPLDLKLVGRGGVVEVRAQLILGQQDNERVIELLIRAKSDAGNGSLPGTSAEPRARGAFLAALAAAADAGQTRAALLLRIDDFRTLEDRLGHVGAQDVAGQLAASTQARLGPADQLFAFSTDELALVVQRDAIEPIEAFAETLRRETKEQIFSVGDQDAQIALSIALYPLGSGESAERVVRDLAAEARRLSESGGNRCAAIGATAQASVSEREDAQRSDLIRRALAEDRFKLAFQTIASLEGDARSHYDVLLRLLDDQGRELHASEFVPAAQRADLMRAIDRWVITTALNVVRQHDPRRPGTTLFVKISEDTVRDAEAFLDWLRALLRARPLRPEDLVFELRELTLQNHLRKGKALTQALGGLAIGVAIEHFGVGANSSQLLGHIPAQFLKFHSSFTQQFSDREVQKRLSGLVDAAKHRRIKTIVSHVEDANAMARLWQMGVNFVQGYHIQEPEVVLLSGESPQR